LEQENKKEEARRLPLEHGRGRGKKRNNNTWRGENRGEEGTSGLRLRGEKGLILV